MPKTTSPTTPDALREKMTRLVGQLDASIPPSLTHAVKSFLTALDYQDPALIRSQLTATLQAFRDVIQEAILKRLGWPRQAREACQDILATVKNWPRETYDDLGKELESRLEGLLKPLTDLRDGPVKLLQDHGYEIENAALLARDIEELEALTRRVLQDWPWSSLEPPPVNRSMVAQSRAAIRRQEGERMEDVIRRLGGVPGKEG